MAFSLLHIGIFAGLHSALWASLDETYDFGPIGWFLLYEICAALRKVLTEVSRSSAR